MRRGWRISLVLSHTPAAQNCRARPKASSDAGLKPRVLSHRPTVTKAAVLPRSGLRLLARAGRQEGTWFWWFLLFQSLLRSRVFPLCRCSDLALCPVLITGCLGGVGLWPPQIPNFCRQFNPQLCYLHCGAFLLASSFGSSVLWCQLGNAPRHPQGKVEVLLGDTPPPREARCCEPGGALRWPQLHLTELQGHSGCPRWEGAPGPSADKGKRAWVAAAAPALSHQVGNVWKLRRPRAPLSLSL